VAEGAEIRSEGKDLGVATIPTGDEDETVSVIAAIARREQKPAAQALTPTARRPTRG
jgi:ERCC4-type nuclease